MKKIFTIVLLLASVNLFAQSYNNEWIDFSKTYYKFKVGSTGLYRIPQSALVSIGLGGVPAEQFQLFRNGKEVTLNTSVASGPLGSSGYIEFWGQMNDGVPDAPLYRIPANQHTQKWSLETDTAVYFLTVNPSGGNLRFQDMPNNVSGSPLTPEPYFMYTAGSYFRTAVNPGFAQVVAEYLYSSSYDMGEFWASGFIYPGSPLSDNQNNLFVYNGGPAASIKFGMAGCADNPRSVQLSVNSSVVATSIMNSFNDLLTTQSIPLSLLSSGSATVQFINNSAVPSDRAVASFYELTYPRQFNFGGQTSFPFQLPAKPGGYLLNITNFAAGSATPILYDLTNGLRYTAVVGSGTLSFALGGSSAPRSLVLVSEDPSTVTTVTGFTAKNFVNFATPANQGNYLIISNPILYTGTSGNNPVADYKNYRSSAAGGGFNTQIYDINELVDQFAFGIKKDPLSIQNFLRYARAVFSVKPQFVLLIGHGMTYVDYFQYSERAHDPLADLLDLVPTFGSPASDNKLSVANGADAVPITPIGRLSVVSGSEIEIYLNKLKEFEQMQASAPNTIDGRLWMKNVLHLTGVSEPYLGGIICNYMSSYRQLISDTLTGANVLLLCDGNASQVSQVPPAFVNTLFSTGFGMLNYFGHSSNTTLGYSLDNPLDYPHTGKFPVFFINGCDAGNFFVYDAQRFGPSKTISENWVLAKDKGSIAFVASTHFGIVNYLSILLNRLYDLLDGVDYGKPLGILQKDALQQLVNVSQTDFFVRMHAEQMTIHGDPSLKLNQGPTDYVVEPSQVQINPSFISINNGTFDVKARFYNLGKAVPDSVEIRIQRTYPNDSTVVLLDKKIPGIRYSDSVEIQVPIIGTRDKGANKITVTINPGNTIPEVTYMNNSVTSDAFIYEDGATPIFPYNYSIINTTTSKLIASTANPFAPAQQYTMQIDTTQAFNSPMLVTKNLNSAGGELEFDPGIVYRDSVVYYWRVGVAPGGGQYTWNNASFVYIDSVRSSVGFNQSHFFQHEGSTGNSITMASNRQWSFIPVDHSIYQVNAVFPDAGKADQDFAVSVDGNHDIQSACLGASLIFNVFDPVTFKAWKNVDANGNNLYLSGSVTANCKPNRNWNFEFSVQDAASRYKMMRFMDSIPDGFWVTVKNIPYDVQASNTYAADWHADTSLYGSGNSLYNSLVNAGFTGLDAYTFPRAFVFIYKKGDPAGFTPQFAFSDGINDHVTLLSTCPGMSYSGSVTSPIFGPSRKWGSVHWRGGDPAGSITDTVGLQVIGIDTLGNTSKLYSLDRSTQDLDISSVSAAQYPYMQLKFSTADSVHAKPYQLNYWRVNYQPFPEGTLAPNILLKSKDTVNIGEPLEFAIAFKNVSPYAFDSMRIKMYILDSKNSMHPINLLRRKPLISGDTVTLDYIISTKNLVGSNTLYVGFNPDNDQPEQYLFNNFLYKAFYVKGDNRNPNLDVTFDNVHILNEDIVSAKPHIQVRLQSPAQYLLLSDTSLVNVQVKFPDGSLHNYGFNSDTLRFTPASGTNNTATVDFYPVFTKQFNPEGDVYELIVSGKDEQGNMAGVTPYRVGFKIISKPMISNMLNYPNPFTTSTAFVFTITGSEVPQNIKIQILTITGKIVREITKDELGPLHIGRNITEFKWNGTDMYGQRLANGVYLYHVVTNLNGKSLDKYKASGDNTDKYFNNGYGKMYLMR